MASREVDGVLIDGLRPVASGSGAVECASELNEVLARNVELDADLEACRAEIRKLRGMLAKARDARDYLSEALTPPEPPVPPDPRRR